MGEAIGQSLPVAVGVLISPMPIVAVVLMLLTPRARSNAAAFLIGWVAGIAVLGTLVLLIADGLAGDDDGPPAWAAWLKLVLGVLLLLLAVKNWRGLPRGDAEPPTPGWMRAVDGFTPVKALGLAVLLGAVNPKNLLLVVSGAAAIASATTDGTARVVALAVFVVIASIGVAAPLVIYLATGDRAAALLGDLRGWMVRHNAAIMTVLLAVIGAKMLGDGITGL
ncbi:GAP family protein [Cellulomonas denverensis]|uniref:GAP family protein n=1 Tax=Cellulomonas denverensis TaxID=264297 RepID=UPI0035E578BD